MTTRPDRHDDPLSPDDVAAAVDDWKTSRDPDDPPIDANVAIVDRPDSRVQMIGVVGIVAGLLVGLVGVVALAFVGADTPGELWPVLGALAGALAMLLRGREG